MAPKLKPRKSPSPPREETGRGVSYFEVSRSLPASLLFILPLLVIYEVGVYQMGGDPSAMAVVAKGPLFLFGQQAALVFNMVVIAAFLYAVLRLAKRGALRLSVFPLMAVESAAYAVVIAAIGQLVEMGLPSALSMPGQQEDLWLRGVAAAGAGVYEELLFRGVLLTALMWVGNNVLAGEKKRPFLVAVAALAVSSALFSAWHFLGGAEAPNWPNFTFRFVAGAWLGGVFLKRGLGIAVWAHAIFNAFFAV